MNDQVWQIIRYVLIAGGGYLAGKGIIPADKVAGLVDTLMNALPGIIAVGSAIWGLWVKAGTKAVPATVAARSDVPTVSAATGAVQR